MYIAGRLRTASSPPRTLIEVASYLWPPTGPVGTGPFVSGVSLSPMNRASPQTWTPSFGSADPSCIHFTFGKAARKWSDLCGLAHIGGPARRLPPIGPSSVVAGPTGTRRVVQRSIPSRFDQCRVDAAKLFSPVAGVCTRLARCDSPWRKRSGSRQAQSVQSADSEESRRHNFNAKGVRFARRFGFPTASLSLLDTDGYGLLVGGLGQNRTSS